MLGDVHARISRGCEKQLSTVQSAHPYPSLPDVFLLVGSRGNRLRPPTDTATRSCAPIWSFAGFASSPAAPRARSPRQTSASATGAGESAPSRAASRWPEGGRRTARRTGGGCAAAWNRATKPPLEGRYMVIHSFFFFFAGGYANLLAFLCANCWRCCRHPNLLMLSYAKLLTSLSCNCAIMLTLVFSLGVRLRGGLCWPGVRR